MKKQGIWRSAAVAAAIAGLLAGLAACGGGPDEGPPPPVGASEPQLFDADSNPTGLVPRRGSGAVVLQLEPNSAQALPLLGDTAGAGTDAVWFDLVRDSALGIKLTDQSLQTVASVALHDLSGAPVWRADASAREAGVWVQRGLPTTPWPRYQLRITPAASATQAAQVIVWFGHADNPAYNAGDLARAGQGGRVICDVRCNLQGAQLGGLNLNGAYLSSANLRNAWLASVDPALLELRDGAAFAVFSDASVVRGANLSGANLSGADLTGAIVNGAGQSPASFVGADLSDAVLNGLNLDRADLLGADLTNAQARAVSLIGADLSGGMLRRLDLRGANLTGANLTGANLTDANLTGANLTDAILTGADLTGALRTGATWTDGRVCVSPSVGRCD
jgi:uncharacterized protein YjbI with pentapeptide repeats